MKIKYACGAALSTAKCVPVLVSATPTTFTRESQSTASTPTTPTQSTVSTVSTTATTASTGTFQFFCQMHRDTNFTKLPSVTS